MRKRKTGSSIPPADAEAELEKAQVALDAATKAAQAAEAVRAVRNAERDAALIVFARSLIK